MSPLVAGLAGLALPVALGGAAGAARLFPSTEAAIAALNRYALYVAFPALVLRAVARPGAALPEGAAWVALPALALALAAAGLWVAPRGPGRGVAGLVAAFGNVAYLGLPLSEQVLGPERAGLTALVVSVHVVLALLVGPALLVAWGGGRGEPAWGRVLGQPLLWAPLLGLAVRAWGGAELALIGPIAASAAPVALFVLGLYLHAERRRLLELRAGDLGVIALRLVGLPALTAALAAAGRAAGLVDGDTAAVVVLLAGMPAAITTFAIAAELEVATDRVARAVVGSTALSAATLPLLAWLTRSLAG